MRIFFIIIILLTFSNSYSQNSLIEINGGINNSNLYFLSSPEDYSNSLTSYNNVVLLIFYTKKISNKTFWKIGLEKTDYKTKAEINHRAGHSSYYHNVIYDMEYLNLYLSFKRNLFKIKKIIFSINTSVFLGYLIKSNERGNGWYLKYILEENPGGDDFSYFVRENWDINTQKAENINKYNFGFTSGITLERRISDKFTINTNINYSLSILKTLVFANSAYNSLRNFNVNIGISYTLNNNKD